MCENCGLTFLLFCVEIFLFFYFSQISGKKCLSGVLVYTRGLYKKVLDLGKKTIRLFYVKNQKSAGFMRIKIIFLDDNFFRLYIRKSP